MSEGEAISIKGETVENLSAARQRLACFRAKGKKYKKMLNDAGPLLEGKPVPANAISQRDWPTHDDLVTVFQGIDSARREIEELEGRLRDWGAIS